MLYREVAAASADVGATRKRTIKIERLSSILTNTEPAVLPVVVDHLSGRLPQGRIGVGYSLLTSIDVAAATTPTLTVADVDATFTNVKSAIGPGSKAVKVGLVESLLRRATSDEQRLIVGLLAGEIRQGALDGVMSEAIARAFGVDGGEVRRAAMLAGDLAAAAVTAATRGSAGLAAYRLRIFQPLQPMLASTAETAAAAVEAVGDAIVDWKLDGARVQIHYDGSAVRVFTRNLRDVTSRLTETVAAAEALPVGSVVLDAEVLALDGSGRPRPFQETMSRFGRAKDDPPVRSTLPLSTFVFDVLHVDGDDLIDAALAERVERLRGFLPDEMTVPRIRTTVGHQADVFLAAALDAGHEGVMVKAAGSLYAAGRRGADWLKVKPALSLDLVVIAAEWGSGRRHGWLSNLHLGARDPSSGRFAMLGKTFKGLTDEMLEWQTKRFLDLESHRDGRVVYVRPEQVVEIAFDGVQESSRYPEGLALRFARVKGYRDDKAPEDADTLETVRAIQRGRHAG